jgi:hypothetical protein
VRQLLLRVRLRRWHEYVVVVSAGEVGWSFCGDVQESVGGRRLVEKGVERWGKIDLQRGTGIAADVDAEAQTGGRRGLAHASECEGRAASGVCIRACLVW